MPLRHVTAFLRRPAARLGALLAAAVWGTAAAAPTLQYGPFEITAQARRISAGGFPNTSGNPFATREITEFVVRWRGRKIDLPGVGDRHWRVLRLTEAPRAALLLVTTDFTLVSEQDGQLQVQAVNSEGSTGGAEAQWLDGAAGQPGPSMRWGIEASDLATGSELKGGRWLRLGSRAVLDVQRLVLHAVDPAVPMVPGQPVTSLTPNGDAARAFSPGATQYVLAGSQTDYARGSGQVYGLLVVGIAAGPTRELRVDRRQMPFAITDDFDAAWIAHYFEWQRDASGREQLQPRPGARPLPWRGRLVEDPYFGLSYRVARARPALLDEVRRLVLTLPGAALAPDAMDPGRSVDGSTVRIGDCTLGLMATDSSPIAEDFDGEVAVYASGSDQAARATCSGPIRRIATLVDAELATGRHDRLIVLD